MALLTSPRRLVLAPLALLLLADSPCGAGPVEFVQSPATCTVLVQATGQPDQGWSCQGSWVHPSGAYPGVITVISFLDPEARPVPTDRGRLEVRAEVPSAPAAGPTYGFNTAADQPLAGSAELADAAGFGYRARADVANLGEGTLVLTATSPPAGSLRYRLLPAVVPIMTQTPGPEGTEVVVTVAFTAQ